MCGERVNLSPTALYTGRSLEVGHGGSLRRLKLSSPGSGPFAVERVSLTARLRVAYVSYRPIDVLRGTGVVTSLWQLYGFSICSLRIEF